MVSRWRCFHRARWFDISEGTGKQGNLKRRGSLHESELKFFFFLIRIEGYVEDSKYTVYLLAFRSCRFTRAIVRFLYFSQ